MTGKPGKPGERLEQIRELIALMRETGVSELALDLPDFKVTIRRDCAGGTAASAAAPAPSTKVVAVEPIAQQTPEAGGLVPVTAPQVGIFTRDAASGTRVVLSPGDWVQAGQVLGGLEAMNVVMEVHSPVSGRVADILVEDGAAVEYGQILFLIESGGSGDATAA